MDSSVHLIINGKVQGVFYRVSMQKKASELGLRGWVKNTEEEGVEAMVEGQRSKLLELVEWCKKGPSGAKVTEVVTEWQLPKSPCSGFEIR